MNTRTHLLVALLAASSIASAAPSPSQCKAGEVTYFNCAVRSADKLVSLCGKDDGPASYLQYRAGTRGGAPEVVYPASRGGREMKEAFFFDDRQDNSRADTGVWFRRENTYYELKYGRDLGALGQVTGAQSEVLMWIGTPKGAPRPLVCQQTNGGAQLQHAKSVIEAVSPVGRRWKLSPLDVHYLPKPQSAQSAQSARPVDDPRDTPRAMPRDTPRDHSSETPREEAGPEPAELKEAAHH